MYNNALRIGLSRQIALRDEVNIIANNVANMNTTGFRSDQLTFKEVLMPHARMNEFKSHDKRPSYMDAPLSVTNFDLGSIIETGNDTDVALASEGFFEIETEKGLRYTRNGVFQVNSLGQLVTLSGDRVMGYDGPFEFEPEETEINIGRDGFLTTNLGVKDALKIVNFENPQLLEKVGDVYFKTPEGVKGFEVDNPNVRQGAIETANLSPVKELSRLIEVQQSYARVSKMLKDIKELNESSITKLGTLPNA